MFAPEEAAASLSPDSILRGIRSRVGNSILLQGNLAAMAEQVTQHPQTVGRFPMVMWPRDRSWYALSEIDFDSTVVGEEDRAHRVPDKRCEARVIPCTTRP